MLLWHVLLYFVMSLLAGMFVRGARRTGIVPGSGKQLFTCLSSFSSRPRGSSFLAAKSKRSASKSIPKSQSVVKGKIVSKAAVGTESVETKSGNPDSKTAQTHSAKNHPNAQILSSYPEMLLPKEISSWSSKSKDFKKLIVHEDDDLIVIFKPAGIMSQPEDDDKLPAIDSFLAQDTEKSSEMQDILVKNNRYFYPDIDILTQATDYLRTKQLSENTSSGSKSRQRLDYNEKEAAAKPFTVGLVHRLDRPASGLMVLAKTPEALRSLNQQFAEQHVLKRYLCMVNGRLELSQNCVDYLLKSSGDITKVIRNPFRNKSSMTQERASTQSTKENVVSIDDFTNSTNELCNEDQEEVVDAGPSLRKDVVRAELAFNSLHVIEHIVRKRWTNTNQSGADKGPKKGKASGKGKQESSPVRNSEQETIVKVMADGFVETKSYQSLLDVTLLTGRKHQIRAQLSHRQHPIVGDQKYLAPQAFGERDISLHAYYLSFYSPSNRRKMAFRMDVPRIWERRFGAEVMGKIAGIVAKPNFDAVKTQAEEPNAEVKSIPETVL